MKSVATPLLRRMANRPATLAWAIVANVLLCGAAYCLVEDTDPISALWWAIVTGSTTGYGDLFPKTLPGRAIGIFFMVSMWLLDRLASAMFVARLLDDPDCFSHSEQEEVMSDVEEGRQHAKASAETAARVEQLLTDLLGRMDDLDARERNVDAREAALTTT